MSIVTGSLWLVTGPLGIQTYGTIEHCPQQEISCPSQNIRNLIPATATTIVAAPLLFSYAYLQQAVATRFQTESEQT